MSEDGAAERFWSELQTLYRAAGKPTLQRLVHLGLEQRPPLSVSHSTINGWLNRKAVPTGRKNERYLGAMIAFLQGQVRPGDRYARLPEGEWGRLLRAAQAQRAEGKRLGRPHHPATLLQPALAQELRERVMPASTVPASTVPAGPRGPFIGRDCELAVLADLVRGIAAGRGGAVLIEGEPGIGKSALVRAALADVVGLGCQVFWGTASELDEALPLQPLLDGLRVRDISANPRREVIARFLRGEIAADRGMDGPAMLAEQLLALTAEECAALPTILVIDDLQWADRASLGLLTRLAGSVRQLPLLLVMMMRPVPQRNELLTLRRSASGASRLRLTGLMAADVAALVEFLAGGAPDSGLLRLADDAAGNPLYLTELVAALARSSMVTVTEDGTATLTAGPAPRSLSEAIADRLDFITKATHEVLQSASLLGPEFTVTDLASLLGRSVADLAMSLHEACAAGILTESGPLLQFRHPLIHAALYEELPAPLRAAWHREAGRALASAGAPADRVARQLVLAAGEPGGSSDRVDDWAIEWLASGAEPLVNQAPQVAARLLTQAVAGMPMGSAQRGLLANHLADALYRIGDRATAEQVASRELEHATEPDTLVGLHWTLAQCRMVAGEFTEGLATLHSVLDTPGLGPRHRGRLLVLAARTHAYGAELEKGNELASVALAEAEEARDTWAISWALHTMAITGFSQGRLSEALSLLDRAVTATEADPALRDLGALLQINKAVALGDLGRAEEALGIARRARQLAYQAGATHRLTQAHSLLAQLAYETGRWDDALAEVSAMPEGLKEPTTACGDLAIAALVSFYRGDVAAARGHLTAAASHAARLGHQFVPLFALARSVDRERAGEPRAALATLTYWLDGGTEQISYTQDILPDAARLAVGVGDLGTADVVATRAATFAAALGTPSAQANALYCQGMVNHDGPLLLAAAEQYRRAGRALPRVKALEAAAAAYARAGEEEQAHETRARAALIYDWLGAPADVARTIAPYQTVHA